MVNFWLTKGPVALYTEGVNPLHLFMKGLTPLKSCATVGRTAPAALSFRKGATRADAGACGPKMLGHWLRNCTKGLILLAAAAKPKHGKDAACGDAWTAFPCAA